MPKHPTGPRTARALGLLAGIAVPPLASLPARADFDSCLAGIQSQAAAAGVSAQTFRSATSGISYDDKVIELSQAQPEFKTPIWDYMAALVDDERVEDGRAAMRQNAAALAQAESRYGVDRYTIAAVWGVESNFGKNLGKMPLVQSLATLACSNNRRRDFFRGELIATLRIIERGDIAPERLTGSWAGAFGQTQFMPTTYHRLVQVGQGPPRSRYGRSSTSRHPREERWTFVSGYFAATPVDR
ncbi:lytic murein transglycosylase, partial [Methylobacterium organophilum]|nr:lytic murein transglycosylase [Methylobacterium organophilum]